ncbi:MAG: hypothetical protein LAT64_14540 [Phycisphaerales bacterium]|nr:hypothetical protein [Planctomycetota bacterium]MCH8509966.1 hypothetical protein [Phycisphaerales bacterium]
MAAHPFADTLAQIRACVDAPWESVAMTLAEHPADTLGDPAEPGTAAWHLHHTAAIFRLHARHLIGPETDAWPPVPAEPLAAVQTLRDDLTRLEAWAADGLHADTMVSYGRDQSASEMLGVMLRHIVWHAAAAHYWCCWKRPDRPGAPSAG